MLVIADIEKEKPLAAKTRAEQAPVPLDLLAFGIHTTVQAAADARVTRAPPRAGGGVLAGYYGRLQDLKELACGLPAPRGFVAHRLVRPTVASEVLVGQSRSVGRRPLTA